MIRTLLRQTATGAKVLLVATLLLGVGYPLAVWGVSRLPGLHERAEGSPLVVDGRVVGSALIGVDPVATGPDPFFHTRPSATGPDSTGGSNLSAFNPEQLRAQQQRRAAVAAREGVAPQRVPDDALTASASGVDPGISPAYAELQVPRVARATGLPEPRLRAMIAEVTGGGLLAERTVAVPELNAAVARAAPGALPIKR